MHPSAPPHAAYGTATPLRGLATAASAAVWVATAGPVLMAAATPTFGWSQAHVQAQIGMVLLGGGLLISGLGQAVAGILVIMWLVRARANADVMSPAPHRLAGGWAIGSWFVPIGNLFLPLLVVTDVVRASNPTGRPLPQAGLWWAGWIGGGLAAPTGVAVLVNSDPLTRGPGVLAFFLVLAAVLYTVAAFAFRSVALTVAAWQDGRIAHIR